MASMGLQLQGPHPSLCLRSKPCNSGVKLRSFASFRVAARTNNLVSWKHRLCLSVDPVLVKRRPFMVLSFKGNSQNDGSDVRNRRFAKVPVQLSHIEKEREEIATDSFDAQNHLSFASQESEDSKGLAMKKLFRKWLIMLTTQTRSPKMNEAFEENPIQNEVLDSNQVTLKVKAVKLLQFSFTQFLSLDASISLPMVIFIPWFLTIRVLYGTEVVKELTPLWVAGPLVLALYINIIKGLCTLYAFCFMQVVKIVKNLPAYCLLLYSYVFEGKLKSFLWICLIKPFSDIKNMDYKEYFRRMFKLLKVWAVEKYLDCIESIWPYYCRTIRFLKKANLI